MTEMMLSRRRLIGGALALGAGAMTGGEAFAAGAERRLAFRNVHNGETVDARWFGARGFDAEGLAEIDHGLRDWRTGQSIRMDRQLIDLLTTVRERLDLAPGKRFDIISGYRSSHTNAALRTKGGAQTGVATKSKHMTGQATDIALPGVDLARVKLAALSMKRGGVGYYPRDGFVHVDTGRVRTW